MFYSQALAYKKSKDRVKGAPFYTRCGYEKYLLINAECVLLYFIFSIALEQKKTPTLNGNEFIIFKDKIQDCIVNFSRFSKRSDDLWLKVVEFVFKRTGGIKVKEVDYENDKAEEKSKRSSRK